MQLNNNRNHIKMSKFILVLFVRKALLVVYKLQDKSSQRTNEKYSFK